jgi:hypothetical protein
VDYQNRPPIIPSQQAQPLSSNKPDIIPLLSFATGRFGARVRILRCQKRFWTGKNQQKCQKTVRNFPLGAPDRRHSKVVVKGVVCLALHLLSIYATQRTHQQVFHSRKRASMCFPWSRKNRVDVEERKGENQTSGRSMQKQYSLSGVQLINDVTISRVIGTGEHLGL